MSSRPESQTGTTPSSDGATGVTSRLFANWTARLAASVLSLTALAPGLVAAEQDTDFFELRIRPLLAEKCYQCHTQKASGGLRLDSREALLKGGSEGPAIVPGKPNQSLLIQSVDGSHETLKMPLGGRLSGREIEDLVRWVENGAPWPDRGEIRAAATEGGFVTEQDKQYWAFVPCHRPAIPKVRDLDWPQIPIDYFILSRLEEQGISPVAPADRRELIRRVTFGLIGLPPTPEEVDAFLRDTSSEAYARVVDRLLESPHYGERWARHWPDVARYAEDDVYGATEGPSRYDNAWRYRDWVVQAFNQDMPYDRFVRAQISGDLLEEKERDGLVAGTGFLSLGVWYYGGIPSPQARAEERFDRIDAVTQGFLGLTVGCARCHDHKYDPVAFEDYWALDGIFASTIYREHPLVKALVVEAYQAHQKKIEHLEGTIEQFLKEQSIRLSEMLAWKTARYVTAVWQLLQDSTLSAPTLALQEGLDSDLLRSWFQYLTEQERRHPFLEAWDRPRSDGATLEEVREVAQTFQEIAISVFEEKREVDARNHVLLEAAKGEPDAEPPILLPNGFVAEDRCVPCEVVFKPIDRTKYILWLDLFGATDLSTSFMKGEYGLFRLKGESLERLLEGEWKEYLATLRSRLKVLTEESPPSFPFVHAVGESPRPGDSPIHVRGNPYQLGDLMPRRFLTVLSRDEPLRYTEGSGRLALADAISSHPLTARHG